MTQRFSTPIVALTRQTASQLATEISASGVLIFHGRKPIRRTYLDSFDGRLARHGIHAYWEVTSRSGHLLIDWGDGDTCTIDGLSTPPRFAADIGNGKMRRRIAALLDGRALLPWADCRGERVDLIHNDDTATPDTRPVLRLESLEFSASDGTTLPIIGVLLSQDTPQGEAAWENLSQLPDFAQSAAAPGVSLMPLLATHQFPMPWIPRPPGEPITAASPAHRAIKTVLQTIATALDANTQGTIEQWDSEFLHDFRVALRRTRSLLSAYRSVLPPARAVHFRARFRALGRLSGAARDLDVLEQQFDALCATVRSHPPGTLEPLRTALRREGAQAHQRLNRYLESPAYRSLLANWRQFLASKRRQPGSIDESIGLVSQIRLEKALTRLIKLIRQVRQGSPPEALHEIRKKAKKLRYLLEIGKQYDLASSPNALSKDLKNLQNALGEYQDTQAQLELLRRVASRLNRVQTPTETWLACGALLETLAIRERQCRRAAIKRCRNFAKTYTAKRNPETKPVALIASKD